MAVENYEYVGTRFVRDEYQHGVVSLGMLNYEIIIRERFFHTAVTDIMLF